MSGYLERLTRGVRGPGGSLKPVVGSIFAPAAAEIAAGPGAWGEEFPVATASQFEASPGRERTKPERRTDTESLPRSFSRMGPVLSGPIPDGRPEERQEPAGRERRFEGIELRSLPALYGQERDFRTQGDERPAGSAPERPVLRPVRPLSPPERNHLHGDDGPQTDQSTSAGTAAAPVPLLRVEAESPAAELHPGALTRRPAARPEGEEVKGMGETAAKLAPRISLSANSVSSSAAGRQNAGVATALPQAARPDEIHIHIGRIEVTAAAPQAAPRQSATPLRKGLELADYLKKGGRG